MTAQRGWTFLLAGGAWLAAIGTALAIEPHAVMAIAVCDRGEVLDLGTSRCLTAKAGAVDDASFAEYAYILARTERYGEALALLDMVENGNTAMILNVRGYAARKLGRIDEGIGYYLRALELDPEHLGAREYLGEAYIAQGRVDEARQQLAEIERRCSVLCEEYAELAKALRRTRAE